MTTFWQQRWWWIKYIQSPFEDADFPANETSIFGSKSGLACLRGLHYFHISFLMHLDKTQSKSAFKLEISDLTWVRPKVWRTNFLCGTTDVVWMWFGDALFDQQLCEDGHVPALFRGPPHPSKVADQFHSPFYLCLCHKLSHRFHYITIDNQGLWRTHCQLLFHRCIISRGQQTCCNSTAVLQQGGEICIPNNCPIPLT